MSQARRDAGCDPSGDVSLGHRCRGVVVGRGHNILVAPRTPRSVSGEKI